MNLRIKCNNIAALAVLLCCFSVSGAMANSGNNISTFFQHRLNNQTEKYNSTTTIKLKDIDKYRLQIWKEWTEANKNHNEEKLISMSKLSDANAGKWQLPQQLEPNAVMPYYWGSKGECENGLPLYLYIHGSGHKDNEWATGLKLCQQFDDAPAAYFIPQIPNMGDHYRWWHKSKQYAWEKLLRLAFVSGQVDPNKVFFFGISEGGYGSQRLASFYADYLAGAGPMAGGEPLINAPVDNCRNIAFSLLTGDKDLGFYRNKLTQYTKDEFEKFQSQNPGAFIHRIELIPERGHSIDYRPTTLWLKKFVRNPYPKHVTWENFEMDGIYRDGFYNLYVNQRSNADNKTRTRYDMKIEDNIINLNVDEVSYVGTEVEPRWGITLKYDRTYKPAETGKLTIYLSPELVNLNKKITLYVNGKKAYNGKVTPQLKHMVNSCAAYFDPARIYPAAIEVDIAEIL
ncbi:MAG: hypothetical protein ACRDDZ_09040 [Marinifilaceae bacterium]